MLSFPNPGNPGQNLQHHCASVWPAQKYNPQGGSIVWLSDFQSQSVTLEKKKIANFYKLAIASARTKDNIEKFDKSKHDPKLLYKTFNNLNVSDSEIILPVHPNKTDLANKFA